MNIFYLDSNPALAASYHGDAHVLKMILESAQLLSSAHHVAGSSSLITSNIYRLTHVNHPCAIWTRKSKQNYEWLFALFTALLDEYSFRYGKLHKSRLLIPYLAIPPVSLSDEAFTTPPLVMDVAFIKDDAVESYREYYRLAKSHLHRYTKRDWPSWLPS